MPIPALLSAALSLELPLGADGAPPKEVRILRAGANRGIVGTEEVEFLFDEQAATEVLSLAQKQRNDFAFDYGHGMFAALAVDPAEAGKAAGWYSVELRGGELWATNVRWTARGAAFLSSKEYRYLSPAVQVDPETRRVRRLLNVALTNIPVLSDLQPLVAASQNAVGSPLPPEEPPMLKNLIAMLSLKADASEQDVLTALAAQNAQGRELLALCGASTAGEALGKVKGWQEKAAQADVLAQQVAAQAAAARKAEIAALLAQAVNAKKVMPAQVEFLSQMGERDIEMLKGYLGTLAAAPPLLPGAVAQPAATSATATLSQADIDVARMLGISQEDLLKQKAKVGSMPIGYQASVSSKA